MLLVLLLASCKGRPLELGEGGEGLDPNGGGSTPAIEQRCLDLAARRVRDAECWPTRHVGRWHGFVTSGAHYWHVLPSPLEYPSGDLLLEVDAEGSAQLTFSGGEAAGGDAGAAEAGVPCSSTAPASCAALPGLVLGFRYELVGLRMTGGPSQDRHQDPRMDFSLTIAEPWNLVCAAIGADAGPCACTTEGCGAAPESLQAILVLSADGRALRGTARSERTCCPGEEPEPQSEQPDLTGGAEASFAGWELVRE
ncbi:MAG: hypothetical protein ABI895_00965 [Deltaproteobacteria bacterium]